MAISSREIEHLMALARLRVGPAEAESLAKDLAQIIEYVGELSRVDTAGTEPMAGGTDLLNRMRGDEERADSFHEEGELLSRAPQKEGRYFKVPRILE